MIDRASPIAFVAFGERLGRVQLAGVSLPAGVSLLSSIRG